MTRGNIGLPGHHCKVCHAPASLPSPLLASALPANNSTRVCACVQSQTATASGPRPWLSWRRWRRTSEAALPWPARGLC